MFFDTEHVYVLAEATKTLSLQDDDVHDTEDSLWTGYSILPRGWTVCEHTLNKPPGDLGNGVETPYSINIINDLKENSLFCDRPFVTGHPNCRFYAGVPITTPSNIRIGTYCILDNKPRDGLSDGDCDFLWQMS